GLNRNSVVLGPQVARLVGGVTAAEVARGSAHDDELWKLAVEGAEAVMGPRSQAGLAAIQDDAAGVEQQLRRVAEVRCPQRTDDGQIVHTVAQMREPVAPLGAALAGLPETDLGAQNPGLQPGGPRKHAKVL